MIRYYYKWMLEGGRVMAFMGIFLMWIILLLIVAPLVLGVLFLIVGAILGHSHHEKSSKIVKLLAKIFFGIFGVICIGIVLLIVWPKSTKVQTHSGEAKLKNSWIDKYRKCLDENNLDELKSLVDAHPNLIYYQDANAVMLLDYGFYNCNIEMMQLALDKGAKFDDPLRYDKMCFPTSLSSFFNKLDYPVGKKSESQKTVEGQATDKMIETIKFAIKNGAKTKWEKDNSMACDNFYECAEEWINKDGQVSKKDQELLDAIPKP